MQFKFGTSVPMAPLMVTLTDETSARTKESKRHFFSSEFAVTSPMMGLSHCIICAVLPLGRKS
jgi:hypothetical protein